MNPRNFPSIRIAIHNHAGGTGTAHSFSEFMVAFWCNGRQNIGLALTFDDLYWLGPDRTPRPGTERPMALGCDYRPLPDCRRPYRVAASSENIFGSAVNELTPIAIVIGATS
jgi:hypothetical protein